MEITGENQQLSMSCAMVAITGEKWCLTTNGNRWTKPTVEHVMCHGRHKQSQMGLTINGHHLRKPTVEHVMCHGRHIRCII